MSTDPYVPVLADDEPRNEPNLAPGVHLPPAESWRADRVGEVGAEGESGALLGNTGPNIGYAMTLATRRADGFVLVPGEHRADAIAVVAEIAMKRAASFGRAPTGPDVDLAIAYLGLAGDAPEVLAWRPALLHGAGHHWLERRRAVGAVPEEILHRTQAEAAAATAEVRAALAAAAGEH
jgi:hypothetical protein